MQLKFELCSGMMAKNREVPNMKVITLSREYGAGGHTIGEAVAKALGIEFYDRDIIRAAAKAGGMEAEQIERQEETLTGAQSFLRNITPIGYDQKDAIFDYEKQAILELAAKGPCVILGRCADAILSEAGIPSLDIFVYGDEDSRAVRVGELLGTTDDEEIRREMKKTDHARRTYYTTYSGRHWGDYRSFDLMLDSGALGYDACVRLICDAARSV